jgi:electron transport complex protein RnfA
MLPSCSLISYIVVIASTVQLVEMFVKKMSPALFRRWVYSPPDHDELCDFGAGLFQTNKGYGCSKASSTPLGPEPVSPWP